MSSVIRTGGGTFDPHEKPVYFLAANTERLSYGVAAHRHLLVAINELKSDLDIERLVSFLTPPGKVLLDSGVYNLATCHAQAHGLSMDDALSTPPSGIDGFASLFDRYVSLVRDYGEKLWGYIEIDQGGRENKIKTRARLEALGMRPIPVYHPFNDGWDYFDYLAERYDRICLGNIVQANPETRRKLLATAWERHRKYPHLWIHVLGLTPNQWLNALPVNSGDSSTWLRPLRWTTFTGYCDGASLGQLGRGYRYALASDPTLSSGSRKAAALSAYMAHMDMRAWRRHLSDLTSLGYALYPPLHAEVRHG